MSDDVVLAAEDAFNFKEVFFGTNICSVEPCRERKDGYANSTAHYSRLLTDSERENILNLTLGLKEDFYENSFNGGNWANKDDLLWNESCPEFSNIDLEETFCNHEVNGAHSQSDFPKLVSQKEAQGEELNHTELSKKALFFPTLGNKNTDAMITASLSSASTAEYLEELTQNQLLCSEIDNNSSQECSATATTNEKIPSVDFLQTEKDYFCGSNCELVQHCLNVNDKGDLTTVERQTVVADINGHMELSEPRVDNLENGDQESTRKEENNNIYPWMKQFRQKKKYQNKASLHPGESDKSVVSDKRGRIAYNRHQLIELEKEFYYTRYLGNTRTTELANSLGLNERQIKIWFQNRRMKFKKEQQQNLLLNREYGVSSSTNPV